MHLVHFPRKYPQVALLQQITHVLKSTGIVVTLSTVEQTFGVSEGLSPLQGALLPVLR
jgi:hypothetical protein